MTGCLASKVVVVTGGGTGIGRAVAGRVVAEGAAVVIGGRRSDVGHPDARCLPHGGKLCAAARWPPGGGSRHRPRTRRTDAQS